MNKTTKRKSAVAFCAAMLMAVSSTIGATGMPIAVNNTAITASAADVQQAEMTVSAERYGLELPAESISIKRGNILIKNLDWVAFKEGYTFKSTTDTIVEIKYDDGVLTLDAYTGKCIRNTRKSGIVRDMFIFDYTALYVKGLIDDGHWDYLPVDEPADTSTGENVPVNTYYFMSEIGFFYDVPNEDDYVTFIPVTDMSFLADEVDYIKQYENYSKKLRESYPNQITFNDLFYGVKVSLPKNANKIYFTFTRQESRFVDIYVCEYDIESNKVTRYTFEEGFHPYVNITPEMFGNEKGYKSVTAYDIPLIDAESGTVLEEQVIFTPDEFERGITIGKNDGAYEDENNRMKFDTTRSLVKFPIKDAAKFRFDYDDGSYSIYAICGELFAVPIEQYFVAYPVERYEYYPVYINPHKITFPDTPPTKFVESEKNGDVIVSDEVIPAPEGEYSVEIYTNIPEAGIENKKSFHKIHDMNKQAFENTVYTIPNYLDDALYFVRFVLDDGNSVIYRYYPEMKGWLKRTDSKEVATANIEISPAQFPNEKNVLGGEVFYKDMKLADISSDEFYSGKFTFPMTTENYMNYEVQLTFLTPEGEESVAVYDFMGIDHVDTLFDDNGNKIPTYWAEIAPNDDYGYQRDFFVDGQTEIFTDDEGNVTDGGDTVRGTVSKINTKGDIPFNLPDGIYNVTDPDTGYYETIIIDRDGSMKKDGDEPVAFPSFKEPDIISIKPIERSAITFKTPDGKEVGNAEKFNDPDVKLENKNDINGDMDDAPYYAYEIVRNIANSTNPDESAETVVETGFCVIDADGHIEYKNIIKGDVNLDGVVNVADLVMAQKYLLNALDENTPFTIDNFIAFDVCSDGMCDAFDMVIERRILIDIMEKTEQTKN